jgi:predicted DsbA family dithiol-disulfide isomerase
MVLQVEIWSDVVCPWCYIGKRRIESALAGFEHADEVQVVYRSFQLDPTAEPFDPSAEPVDVPTYLGRKYGGGREAGLGMIANVTQIAAGDGLHYDLEHAHGSNTMDAHRLLHAGLADGGPALQGAVTEELMSAYFTRARNISDPAVLVELAVAGGLDEQRARAVLASDDYRADVEADQAQAQAFGATGVPFFVIDRRYGVSGAQPAAVLARALAQAWSDRETATV